MDSERRLTDAVTSPDDRAATHPGQISLTGKDADTLHPPTAGTGQEEPF